MRYYHYGQLPSENKDVHAPGIITAASINESYANHAKKSKSESDSELIIEDDTVYEIDNECIKCRKEKTL